MSLSSDIEFTGKRALVTGGTRGIGEAIVQRLSGAGATVVTTARSAPHDLPQPDLFVKADLGTAEGAETVVRFVRGRLGGVDILIHNVGGSSAPGGGFAALTDDAWQQALNSNLLAAVRLDRGLLPLMVAQGADVIIHIASNSGACRCSRRRLRMPPRRRPSPLTARASRTRSARRASGSSAWRRGSPRPRPPPR